MLSKKYKFILKSFLSKAAGASLVALLLLCGTISKFEPVKIQADTNVQINPFVWLCSYFGINIYTDAQEINEAFYTAIQDAYNVWMLTQQPQQRVSIDDIIGSISWDSQQPKMVKITGWAFNAMRSFANYLDSKVTTSSEAIELGNYEIEGDLNYYTPLTNLNYATRNNGLTGYCRTYDDNVRVVFFVMTNSTYNSGIYAGIATPTTNTGDLRFGYSSAYSSTSWQTYTLGNSSQIYNGYYVTNYKLMDDSLRTPLVDLIFNLPYSQAPSGNALKQIILDYTFGSNAGSEGTLADVYALPEQAVLDDLIGAADPESDVTIDIEDSDLPWSTAATLQDILDAINSLTDTYVLDNSWPETIGKTIAQSIAIDNEITDVEYPDAITWQVPDLIGTPVITPLIEPECPTLSACLVAGIEDVGETMNSVIESNSNVSNYVSASLFLGLSLMILGAFI